MRTKTLLITAALTAAGALTSMAQVYSVNIVGYINLAVPAGFSIIANQLNNSPDNLVTTILASGVPDSTTVYKFDATTAGYAINTFTEGVGWDGNDLLMTMNPGEGVFINAPSAFTATFVGEVKLVSDNRIYHGYSIMSSTIPQSGAIDTDLKWAPIDSDTVFQFNNATRGYIINTYTDGVGWDGNSGGLAPNLKVGEGFFVNSPSTSLTRKWHRCFNVDGTDCP